MSIACSTWGKLTFFNVLWTVEECANLSEWQYCHIASVYRVIAVYRTWTYPSSSTYHPTVDSCSSRGTSLRCINIHRRRKISWVFPLTMLEPSKPRPCHTFSTLPPNGPSHSTQPTLTWKLMHHPFCPFIHPPFESFSLFTIKYPFLTLLIQFDQTRNGI